MATEEIQKTYLTVSLKAPSVLMLSLCGAFSLVYYVFEMWTFDQMNAQINKDFFKNHLKKYNTSKMSNVHYKLFSLLPEPLLSDFSVSDYS